MSTGIGEIDKKYTLTKKIGSGGTSKVYLAYKTDNPKEVFAVKILKPSNNSSSNDSKVFINEINVLKNIKHQNVVRLADGGEGILVRDNGKKYAIQYLVLELIKFGELFDYIFFPQKGFGEEIGKYIFPQLIDGLESIHKSGFVHRDMKTENIMLGENWQAKIADFGFSIKTEGKKGNGLLYTALGTASYASPELLQKKPYYGIPSDIFSLGVSLFVLVTGKMPFKHALTDDPYYKEIVAGNSDRYWQKLENKVPPVSKEFKEIFVKLISYDPKNRPSLDDCRKCDWMKNSKPDMEKINKEFTERTKVVQQKKELERRKEEQEEKEKTKKNGFEEYRDDGVDGKDLEVNQTTEDLPIRDFDEETLNLYTLSYPHEDKPGSLYDFVVNRLSRNKKLGITKHEGKYKLSVGCELLDMNEEVTLGGGEILDSTEALIEIKKSKEGFILEVNKTIGSKYDFYQLFNEISNLLKI